MKSIPCLMIKNKKNNYDFICDINDLEIVKPIFLTNKKENSKNALWFHLWSCNNWFIWFGSIRWLLVLVCIMGIIRFLKYWFNIVRDFIKILKNYNKKTQSLFIYSHWIILYKFLFFRSDLLLSSSHLYFYSNFYT